MADSPVQTGVASFDRFEQLLVAGGELLRQNRVAEAREQFSAALSIRSDDPKALGLLGLSCFRLADFQAALPVYEQLVALLPEDASHRLNLGLVFLKLGQPEAAIRELTRCRQLDPSQSRAVGYLGLAYARNGQYADAYQAFTQAGQSELAREMTQYLTADECARIDAALGATAAGASPEAAADGAEPRARAAEPTTDGATEELDDADLVEHDEPRAGAAPPPLRPEVEVVPERARDAAPRQPMRAPSIITRAVEDAVPSSSAAAAATRVASGHRPPQSLSEFATSRLIRPEDGDHPFEISAGGVLIVRVQGRVFARTEGVHISGGELAYEVATRRVRGSSTGEALGGDGGKLFIVSGHGHLVAAPLGEHFTAVTLDDDIFYLREELVFAFEEQLRWENGHVPGSKASIPMIQFRGQGCVAFRTREPLLAVKLAPERVLYVDANILAGWIGRVVPRVVAPAAAKKASSLFVECSGEGVVLVEEAQQEDAGAAEPAPDRP